MKKLIFTLLIGLCGTVQAGVNLIDKIVPKNGAFQGLVDSSQTIVNPTAFDGALSASDTDAQKAFETLDNKVVQIDPTSPQTGAISIGSATINGSVVIKSSSAFRNNITASGLSIPGFSYNAVLSNKKSSFGTGSHLNSPSIVFAHDDNPFTLRNDTVFMSHISSYTASRHAIAWYLYSYPFSVGELASLSYDASGTYPAHSTFTVDSISVNSFDSLNINATYGVIGTTGTFSGVSVSTITSSSATISNLTVSTLTVAGSADWPSFVPSSGDAYRMAGSSATLTVGQMAVISSTNGAIRSEPIPTGGGSSSSGTVIASTQYQVAVYSVAGTSNVVTGSPNMSINGSTITFNDVASWTMNNLSTVTASGVSFNYTGSTITASKYACTDGTFFTSTSTLGGGTGSGDVVAAGTNTLTGGNALMGSTTFYGEIHFANKSTFTLTNINLQPTLLTIIPSSNQVNAIQVSTSGASPYSFSVSSNGYANASSGISIKGLSYSIATVTGNSTLTSTSTVVLANCSSSCTQTLPTAVGKEGQIFLIKIVGAGVATINTTASQTIDGSLSITPSPNQWTNIEVISDGTNWYLL